MMTTRQKQFTVGILGVALIVSVIANYDNLALIKDRLLGIINPTLSDVQEGMRRHLVPEYCASSTVRTIRDGSWSDATIWSTGKLPTTDDKVIIDNNVTYDRVSDDSINCIKIEVGAALRFNPNVNTRLKVTTILDKGTLEVGTAVQPILSGVKAEIVIADRPIDTNFDPERRGHGIIAMGVAIIRGTPLATTFSRLSGELSAGATTISTEDALTGWRAGDTVLLPDSRQLSVSEWGAKGELYKPQHETATIAAVNGTTITLTTPLKYAHKGARNGDNVLEFRPHVGNLTRNVIIRSENPSGTRGQTICIYRGYCDFEYTEFDGLGRTRADVILDAATNHIGSYPIHIHHDYGPVPAPADGQFKLVGNAVSDAPKWCIAIHASSYGLIKDNVVFGCTGSGIVTEDGSETNNVFDHNFSVYSKGSGDDADARGKNNQPFDMGHEGADFWFRGTHNYVRNNVGSGAGDSIYMYYLTNNVDTFLTAPFYSRIANFPGADISKDSEMTLMTQDNLLEFKNNEAYGAAPNGISDWRGGPAMTHRLFQDSRVWNVHGIGFFAWATGAVQLSNVTILGDRSKMNEATTVGIDMPQPYGFYSYIDKSRIENMYLGIIPGSVHSEVTNSYFRNYYNAATQSNNNDSRSDAIKIYKNDIFKTPASTPLAGKPFSAFLMGFDTSRAQELMFMRDWVLVDDSSFDGVKYTGPYQMYFKEQAPSYKVSSACYSPNCSVLITPEFNTTNAILWDKYSIAIADAVAPCSTATTSVTTGFVCKGHQTNPVIRWTDNSNPLLWQVDEKVIREPFAVLDYIKPGVNFVTKHAHQGKEVFRKTLVVVGPSTSSSPGNPGHAPTVFPPNDKVLQFPTKTAELDALVTDDTDTPAKLTWQKISGPGTVTFNSPNTAYSNARFSLPGYYELALVATNDKGSATGKLHVLVLDPSVLPDCPTCSQGMLLYHPFENTLSDYSGNNNPAVAYKDVLVPENNPMQYGTGKVDRAILLNGKNYFLPTNGNKVAFTNAFTVSAWIKPNTVPGVIFGHETYNDSATKVRVFVITNKDGSVTALAGAATLGYEATSTTLPGVITAGQWHHVIATYNDVGDRLVHLYVDGIEAPGDRRKKYQENVPWGGGGYAEIAGTAYYPRIDGLMDEFRVYNRALTAEDAMALFVAPAKIASQVVIPPTPTPSSTPPPTPTPTPTTIKTPTPSVLPTKTPTPSVTTTITPRIDPTVPPPTQTPTPTVTTSTLPPPNCSNCTTNLQLYYPFDNGSKDDFSGTYNHGTATGNPLTSDGVVNQSLKFNGSTELIRPRLTFYPQKEFTVSMWVRPSANTYASLFRSNIYNDAVEKSRLALLSNTDGSVTGLAGSGQLGLVAVSTTKPGVLSLNAWHHIAMTYNDTSDRIIHLYVDGVEAPPANRKPLTAGWNAGGTTEVGGSPNQSGYFNGSIDEVLAYDRAFSLSEISALYQTPANVATMIKNAFPVPTLPPTSECSSCGNGLALYYPLDGDIRDYSGSTNPAVVTGTTNYSGGKNGQSLSVTGNTNYLRTTKLFNPATAFTVSAWVKPTAYSGVVFYNDIGNDDGRKGRVLLVLGADGTVSGVAGSGNFGSWAQTTSLPGVITLNSWNHVLMTYDDTTDRVVHLYVNGIEAPPDLRKKMDGAWSGSGWSSVVGNMTGSIDEVYAYNRALSSSEIASLFQNPSAVANMLKQAHPQASGFQKFLANIFGFFGIH